MLGRPSHRCRGLVHDSTLAHDPTHSLVDRELRGDRSDVAPMPLFLDLDRVVEDRFEIVEVVEHDPERDAGPFRDTAGGGLGVALFE
jgi:hypothetical protein